jgi:hypothetical protein
MDSMPIEILCGLLSASSNLSLACTNMSCRSSLHLCMCENAFLEGHRFLMPSDYSDGEARSFLTSLTNKMRHLRILELVLLTPHLSGDSHLTSMRTTFTSLTSLSIDICRWTIPVLKSPVDVCRITMSTDLVAWLPTSLTRLELKSTVLPQRTMAGSPYFAISRHQLHLELPNLKFLEIPFPRRYFDAANLTKHTSLEELKLVCHDEVGFAIPNRLRRLTLNHSLETFIYGNDNPPHLTHLDMICGGFRSRFIQMSECKFISSHASFRALRHLTLRSRPSPDLMMGSDLTDVLLMIHRICPLSNLTALTSLELHVVSPKNIAGMETNVRELLPRLEMLRVIPLL